MKNKKEFAVGVFNRDITTNKGYLYTTNARLSSYLANRRLTDVALTIINFNGKRILDIGCGDGTYTLELFDRGRPMSICGIDPAWGAIRIAQQKIGIRHIIFEVQNADILSYASKSFDIAHLRGVLHHIDRPSDALREAFRVAKTLVVIEPNGYNPILKLLERFYRYHVEHNEKSYTPSTLEKWVNQMGAKVQTRYYIGLVPFFCPDWLAKLLKLIEPVVERLPIINSLFCAVYIFTASAVNNN